VTSFEEYWRAATECVRLARVADDSQRKATWLQMAAAWIRLAERAKAQSEKQAA
jgi:hypothetical protein